MQALDFHCLLQTLAAVTHCVSHLPAHTPPSPASQSNHPLALLFPQASVEASSLCVAILWGKAEHIVLGPHIVHCEHSAWWSVASAQYSLPHSKPPLPDAPGHLHFSCVVLSSHFRTWYVRGPNHGLIPLPLPSHFSELPSIMASNGGDSSMHTVPEIEASICPWPWTLLHFHF